MALSGQTTQHPWLASCSGSALPYYTSGLWNAIHPAIVFPLIILTCAYKADSGFISTIQAFPGLSVSRQTRL
ncbi:hypothetical protein BOTBODRAFT_66483 [Botryobasidium botryosum FD-172 SS1]|uniref:Uncharacterized protein n=1 Tax=Botryobasidium botryosum (strain FD-172 SS1) TaxID=930990 RepID=A0A067ME53_BOTB1|nr:hypothetical protein BOTBODRAFT_66483 [Botryobasidium botryosum FD-172 SS1]